MIDLWYCNIAHFKADDLSQLREFVPANEMALVDRFHFVNDKLSKLLGRVLVRMFFKSTTLDFRETDQGKPYVENEKKFNITHSGDLIVVAFSEHFIGVDIEKVEAIDSSSVMQFMHDSEIEFLNTKNADLQTFYRIWTRKESFLKAKGVGIVNGLSHHNCLQNTVNDNSVEWHIKSIELHENYGCAICQCNPIQEIRIKEITKQEIIEYVNYKEAII